MNCKFLRNFAVALFCFSAAIPTYGQDFLASQAPIDRKLKAVDSVTLKHLNKFDKKVSDGLLLYKTWNNENTHCYSEAEVPDSFTIDLRGFAMPTPSRKVTSNYGYRKTFRRMHRGLDIKVYTGDTIYAAFDGKVRIVRFERKGYGKYVVIRHENGLETIYGHLSKQLVKVNDEVKAGEPIGLGGNTGRSYGSHLHFETRLAGHAINPALLFDFVNQDVTCDFYTFVKNKSSKSSSNNLAGSNSKAGSSRYYKVKKGDSLYTIARKVGTSVNNLCKINRINKNRTLRPGQILKY